MPARVLVPIDGGEQARAALEFALEEFPDAEFVAIHVTDPGTIYRATGLETGAKTDLETGTGVRDDYERIRTRREAEVDRLLEEARRQAEAAGVALETEALVGKVPKRIIAYAEDHDVDRLVIGSHGRTGASRLLLGSVAETVARRSPVPVTIVR
ncbi:UspA domain-containing protein [Natronococcus amylolyticus DSM 10524]|uniref:UspA domain-containing protein n=1 Tax=Natronococcus amylolyticus DSM 10524 TaxID=1227497 RepID=L9X1I8_9EURY|nr:universal stress protein [Natronococcus amylolyticus]ELY55467.1 UspA domain-containing protein [Natronococcus amylolyticus DSM 10524]